MRQFKDDSGKDSRSDQDKKKAQRLRETAAQLRYAKTEAGKATRKRYVKSAKGKANYKRYRSTDKYRAVKKKYMSSELGQVVAWINRQRPENRLLHLLHDQERR